MFTLRLLWLPALACLLFVPDAHAQLSPSPGRTTNTPAQITGYDRGTIRTLHVSGTRGDYMETLVAPGNGWLYGLEIGERRDQPCYVGLWAVESDAPGTSSPAVTFNQCDNAPTERSVAALGFEKAKNQEDWRRARRAAVGMGLGIPIYSEIRLLSFLIGAAFDNSDPSPPLPTFEDQPVALDGIGICQNTSNDEMKGLLVYGSRLGFDGARISTDPIVSTGTRVVDNVTIPPGTREFERFERPNCSNSGGWQDIQMCAADEVMVGLDIHYKRPGFGGNQNRARITGLAPKCARVRIQRG